MRLLFSLPTYSFTQEKNMYLNCQFVKVHCVSNRLIKPLLMIFLGGFMATAAAQNYQTNITAASNWLASTSNPRVTLADGAVVDGANSARINPYFANLGVIGWTKDPNHYTNVKNYMEWYWNHVSWPRNFNVSGCTVNPASGALYGAINDFDVASNGAETPVPDPDAQGNHHPDSTDSYAGTFLSLAYAYYQTGDANAQAYIRSITIGPNGDRLDYVGEVVIATKQTNNLTCARPDFNIEYLMDNAEAYRGLRDLQTLYTALGATSKASFYQAHADQMLNAIQAALWNASNSDYFWYTTVTSASGTVNWNAWYPDAVSQVFPIALGIIQPTDTRAINLWNTFQSHWQNQWTSLSTGDSYPWVIVGYAAALMGDTADANTFITNLQNTYVNNNFVGNASHFWSTNEAGWFIRLNAQMLGSSGGSGGGSFITIPGNATTFSDMDDPPPSGAAWSVWNDCAGCSGNPGGDAQHSNIFSSDSTAPDGQARQFAITTNSSQFQGFLWYSHFPSLNSTNWVFDYYVKISDPGNKGSVEFDGNQTSPDGLNNFVFGTECNYGANTAQATIWRFWTKDTSGERWFDSSLNCALTAAGDWYHVQMHFDTLANNQYRVDEVVITDVTTNVVVTNMNLGLVLNGVGNNTGHGSSIDIQLDGVNNNNYSATYSKLNVSRW